MLRISLTLAIAALTLGGAFAQETITIEPAKVVTTPTVVPFKLSKTQHVVVRVKIDGKGPFHFVVDTGCPVLVISTEAAKKAGLESNNGVGVINRLEFEGGLRQDNVKARVETPFQIEGMNAMGLPGVELHGLMGYTVLAKYKIELDLPRERMIWTPLAFDPPPLEKLKLKDGGSSIEIMGTMMKVLSKLAGIKPGPPATPRGFVGIELEQHDKSLRVSAVLKGSPADQAGVQVGDTLESVAGKTTNTIAEALTAVSEIRAGHEVTLDLVRNGKKSQVRFKAGAGI